MLQCTLGNHTIQRLRTYFLNVEKKSGSCSRRKSSRHPHRYSHVIGIRILVMSALREGVFFFEWGSEILVI